MIPIVTHTYTYKFTLKLQAQYKQNRQVFLFVLFCLFLLMVLLRRSFPPGLTAGIRSLTDGHSRLLVHPTDYWSGCGQFSLSTPLESDFSPCVRSGQFSSNIPRWSMVNRLDIHHPRFPNTSSHRAYAAAKRSHS